MDLGDLKIEADRLGYRLVKKTEYAVFKPCICGYNRRSRRQSPDGIFFECEHCGLKSKPGKNETEARKMWNRMAEHYINKPEPEEAPFGRNKYEKIVANY